MKRRNMSTETLIIAVVGTTFFMNFFTHTTMLSSPAIKPLQPSKFSVEKTEKVSTQIEEAIQELGPYLDLANAKILTEEIESEPETDEIQEVVSEPVIEDTNVDYNGQPILSEAEMGFIEKYRYIYEGAAQEFDIPWQMLAALHYRENNLRLVNPSNWQGIYQIVKSSHTPGDTSIEDFAQQTREAAAFLKESVPELTADSDGSAVKYAFFRYNGAYDYYENQALRLGFSQEEAKNGEGSPYVMNRVDASRDAGTWTELISGGSQQASTRYGTYVIFQALGGES